MLIAIPSSRETVDRLLDNLIREHPNIDLTSFHLPIDISCNYQWNIISMRNFAPMIEWFLKNRAYSVDEKRDENSDILKLEDLFSEIIGNPEHAIVVQGERTDFTLQHILNHENWVSNHSSIAIYRAFINKFGPEYSDATSLFSPNNPWIEIALTAAKEEAGGFGIIQKLTSLLGGPRYVYLQIPRLAPFFNRSKLYEIIEDRPVSPTRRRIELMVHWVNKYEVIPELVAWNTAILAGVPEIFGRNRYLKRIPGFKLGIANVSIEFPDGDYNGRWYVTIEYNVTPIDRLSIMSHPWTVNRELYGVSERLAEENIELRRTTKILEDEVKKRTAELEEVNAKLRDQEVTELLGDVMGWVRHSLGQPMMALVGYIKGLQGSETKYAESKKQTYDAAQDLSSRISLLHGEMEKTPGTEESYRNILTAFDKDILEPTVQLMRATKYLGEEYDPAFQKDISGATQVITQIRGLVSNLEKFVRREDPVNMSLIPLRDYVTQYVGVYSQGTFQDGLPYGLQENSIVIEIDIPEDLTVYSAKGVLDDIFYNPLQNCIDHAFLDKEKDVEGRIGIKGYSITEDGIDKTIIEISDNGCGMSEDTLKNIFKPQVTAKKIGMGGLGAASLKRWVLWHRYGSVEYESEPGRGTLVRITLPAREHR